MKFAPKANAQDLWEINEEMAADSLLYAKNMEETPLPWDANITVEGDKVIIVGSIVGGSSNKYDQAGYCRCEISVDKFPNVYYIEIPDQYLQPQKNEADEIMSQKELLEALEGAGWYKI